MRRLSKVAGVTFVFAGLVLLPVRAAGQEPLNQAGPTWQVCTPGEVIALDRLAEWGVNPADVAGLGLQNEAGEFVCPATGQFPIPPGPGGDLSEWDRIRRAIGAWAGVIVAPLFPDPPPPAPEEGAEDPAPPAPPAPPPSGYLAPGGR
ncbi:MAG: hypothetical protein KatS3mg060_1468 [Dehalococcoidia bacterium]|nr:MAG: hypothetical protein KatS3mg060_1468 [Dehalococcoidia bacterium]